MRGRRYGHARSQPRVAHSRSHSAVTSSPLLRRQRLAQAHTHCSHTRFGIAGALATFRCLPPPLYKCRTASQQKNGPTIQCKSARTSQSTGWCAAAGWTCVSRKPRVQYTQLAAGAARQLAVDRELIALPAHLRGSAAPAATTNTGHGERVEPPKGVCLWRRRRRRCLACSCRHARARRRKLVQRRECGDGGGERWLRVCADLPRSGPADSSPAFICTGPHHHISRLGAAAPYQRKSDHTCEQANV
jgi:hypothetical protein